MSVKWMGCLNHNIKYVPSERLRESPTATVTVRPSIY